MSSTVTPAPREFANSPPQSLPTFASLRLRAWHWMLTPGFVRHTPAARIRGWARVLIWYNSIRTHQALGSRTPDGVYFQTSGLREAA